MKLSVTRIKRFNRPTSKRRESILSTAFIVAMILVVFGIDIYRKTIIDPWILVGVTTVGVTFGCYLLWRKEVTTKGSILSLFTCAGIGGGCLYFLFLFLNKNFAEGGSITETFPIRESGRLAGRYGGEAFVDIDFHGQKKEIVFKRGDVDRPIESYTTVRLQYRKGLFGFLYVEEQELLVNDTD